MSIPPPPPKRCVKCGSEKFKQAVLSMYGKDGAFGGGATRFNVHICEQCGYSEIFYKNKSNWI